MCFVYLLTAYSQAPSDGGDDPDAGGDSGSLSLVVASDDDGDGGDDFEDFWNKVQNDVSSGVVNVLPDEQDAIANTCPDTLVVLDSPAKPVPTPATDRAEACDGDDQEEDAASEGNDEILEECGEDDQNKDGHCGTSDLEGKDSEVLALSDDEGTCKDTAGDGAPVRATSADKAWKCKCGYPPEECSCESMTELRKMIASVKAQIVARILRSAFKILVVCR